MNLEKGVAVLLTSQSDSSFSRLYRKSRSEGSRARRYMLFPFKVAIAKFPYKPVRRVLPNIRFYTWSPAFQTEREALRPAFSALPDCVAFFLLQTFLLPPR